MPSKQIRVVLSCVFVVAALGILLSRLPGFARAAQENNGEFPADWFYDKPDDPDQQFMNELVGKPMPALSVSDWHNGEVKPADMKGKVVIVDLWATWCKPCVAAIPHNKELLEKYKDRGLIIVGVCTAEGQENLQDVIKEKQLDYPVCKDPDLKTHEAYHVKGYPTYVAIDRKGIVRAVGMMPSKVEGVIKKLLDEKAK